MYEQVSKEELIRTLNDAREGKMTPSTSLQENIIAELRRRAGPREKSERPKPPAPRPRFFYMAFQASGRVWRAAVAYVVFDRDVVFQTAWCNPNDRYSKKYGRELALSRLTDRDASISVTENIATIIVGEGIANSPKFVIPRGMTPAGALHLLLSRLLELRTFGVRLVRIPDGLVRDHLGDFKPRKTPAELSTRFRAAMTPQSERPIRVETEHAFRVSPQSDGTFVVERKKP